MDFTKLWVTIPPFSGKHKDYLTWSHKVHFVWMVKPEEVTGDQFIRLIFLRLEGIAAEWVGNLYRDAEAIPDGAPQAPPLPDYLTDYTQFMHYMQRKWQDPNILRRNKEDFWECKMHKGETMRQYVERFDKLRLQNNHSAELAGPVFEHSVPNAIQALMTLQEFNQSSMTAYYHVAEKAYDILEKQGNLKTMFPGIHISTSKNGQGRRENGNGQYYSTRPSPRPSTSTERTTSEGGEAMDLSAGTMRRSNIRCFKCGHFGHIAKFCPRTTGLSSEAANKATQADCSFGGRRQGGKGKGKRQANAMTIEGNAGSSTVNNNTLSPYYLFDAAAFEAEDNSMVFLPVEIGSGKFDALIDTGANRNFILAEAVRAAGVSTTRTKPKELCMADGTIKTLDEKAFLIVKCGDWEFCDEFVVAPVHFEVILGTPWLQHFDVELDFEENGVFISTSNGWQMWR